jgi:hypothetical protein
VGKGFQTQTYGWGPGREVESPHHQSIELLTPRLTGGDAPRRDQHTSYSMRPPPPPPPTYGGKGKGEKAMGGMGGGGGQGKGGGNASLDAQDSRRTPPQQPPQQQQQKRPTETPTEGGAGLLTLAKPPEVQAEGGGSAPQALAPPSSPPGEAQELDKEISEAADGDALAGLEEGTEVEQLELQLNEPQSTPEREGTADVGQPELQLNEPHSTREGGGTATESAATAGPASDVGASHAHTGSPKRKDKEEGEWEEGTHEKRRSPPVTPAQMNDSVAAEKIDQYGSMIMTDADAEILEGVPEAEVDTDTDINMI